jgi:hypothetical protein
MPKSCSFHVIRHAVDAVKSQPGAFYYGENITMIELAESAA